MLTSVHSTSIKVDGPDGHIESQGNAFLWAATDFNTVYGEAVGQSDSHDWLTVPVIKCLPQNFAGEAPQFHPHSGRPEATALSFSFWGSKEIQCVFEQFSGMVLLVFPVLTLALSQLLLTLVGMEM